MFKVEAAPNMEALSRAFRELGRDQIPFAFALASTRLAQRVKKGSLSIMRQRLDRPTSTTMNSMFVQMAKKNKPEAKTYFKDAWNSGVPADTYLQQAVKGARRPHKRFEKALIANGYMKNSQYAIPVSSALNQFGNVSRGVMMKILSGLGAAESVRGYDANATGSKRSKRKGNAQRYFAANIDGTEGIWERKSTAFGDGVRPVFIFSDGAPGYRVIFPFYKVAENIVKANYAREFTSALEHAIATAKR